MYSVADYGRMIADETRMRAYVESMERVIKPGSVVLDLGAGTGIFSLHACRLGARKVYAIEPNPAVHLLRDLARRNSFEGRIEVFDKPSSEVTLSERVDVIVSDLRGASPLYGRHLAVLRDAKERFLVEGGVVLPTEDTLMMCLASTPELYEEAIGPLRRTGFDLQPCVDEVANSLLSDAGHSVTREQCVSAPTAWATIDYAAAQNTARGAVVLRCERDATVHGVATWFRARIWGDIGFENAPGTQMTYRRLLLPWPRPVELPEGTEVTVKVDTLAGGDDYWFAWSTRIAGGPSFKQSNFLSVHAAAQTRASRPMVSG
jgi:protein arginine N-methyltransferase 1